MQLQCGVRESRHWSLRWLLPNSHSNHCILKLSDPRDSISGPGYCLHIRAIFSGLLAVFIGTGNLDPEFSSWGNKKIKQIQNCHCLSNNVSCCKLWLHYHLAPCSTRYLRRAKNWVGTLSNCRAYLLWASGRLCFQWFHLRYLAHARNCSGSQVSRSSLSGNFYDDNLYYSIWAYLWMDVSEHPEPLGCSFGACLTLMR